MEFCLNTLRLRMGWTRQELKRWLGCTSDELDRWIAERKVPKGLYNSKIALMVHNTEVQQAIVQSMPIAEKLLLEKKIAQINLKKAV